MAKRARRGRGEGSARNVSAVVYLRASSDKQETSVPDQRVAVEAYAKANGYRVLREYVDDGISGDATDKRVAFQKMIRDAERGDFGVVLVWDQDRFGRFDSVEAGHWIYPLRNAGVRLVTVNDGEIDWTDFAGRLIYTIKQEGKHAFLRDISRNSLRGKVSAAKRGDWLGRPPFAYRVEDKRLVLGPTLEIDTVRRIFNEYLSGKSLRTLAKGLNDDAVPTPTGRPWSATTVRMKLACEAYIGRFVWNTDRQGKYNAIVGGEVSDEFDTGPVEHDDRITIEDNHPAIIDREDFDAVQRRLQENRARTTPKRNGGRFLFTGVIRCGKCGSRMHGRDTDGVLYYSCTGYEHKLTCDRNSVRQDVLVSSTLGTVEERLLAPANRDRLRDELRRQVTEGQAQGDAETLRGELASVEAQLAKAKRRLVEVDADLIDVVQEQVRSLRADEERLRERLAVAETPADRLVLDHERRVEAAFSWLGRLQEAFDQGDDLIKRDFVRQAFSQIDLWSDRDESHGCRPYRLKRGLVHLRSEGAGLSVLSSRGSPQA